MTRTTLHDGWRLSAVGGPIPAAVADREVPAVVPGSTHLDLLAANLIPEPYLDTNEAELAWMHRADWRYALTFEAEAAEPGEKVELAFDGLDTVATVELNGVVLGRTANMFRSYRFDVREHLKDGANDLVVTFSSALAYAEQQEQALGRRDRAYPHPMNAVRKMACSFGWDWGPDLQTAGIWKPVRLERWTEARLAQVRPLVTVDEDGTGRVEVHVEVDRARDAELTVVATVAGVERRARVEGDSAVVTVEVPDVDLWWPVGYGEHPLYDLDVVLRADERDVDRTGRRIGFRTIIVDTTPDEVGTPFTFVVNGKPVFAKGANWIPDDHFLTRITRDRLARRVDQAVDANMNMLRIWGGGIYETEDFYDVCDERGVLVWQDFLFACAAYAEDSPLWEEVEAEARENVARLTSHASLALWNGNNENLWGFADWGWEEQLQGRSWGLRYYTELLPGIVAELDPTRHYSPGSPYSPGDLHPNEDTHGTRHEWEVWNRIDYTHYRDFTPRFCSEFGFQGPPTWATLTEWVHDEPMTPTSPAFLLHQKAEDGNGKLDRGLAPHLPAPAEFADWHWATQLNQARAVAFGIEHFRSHWPRTAGALVWQLNDCWPVTSWAAIDGDERLKPLYYALKHAFAPRLLTVQPRDGVDALIAVNDTDEAWTSEVSLERQTFAGDVLAAVKLPLDVPARSVARLDLAAELRTPGDPKGEVLVVSTADARTAHLFREDLELAYDPAPLTAEVRRVDGGYRVDVTASSFARDVAVLADRVAEDAVVDDTLVTLPAGGTHSFLVRTAAELADPAALAGPLVLRSANDLCAVRT
ncbi:beta-mannosidase [Saccharothrix sp. NRRL B-16348]|uniref:glycoside hydrolase family 2 protein n=1 Tax=Saccharothrix sp. NRRL B-16348 TaxID=1415542 RepID=UPI0006AF48DD|nr:glycoside hydrolase family 2 protein [Saccharothrix sp. NRRL B-16348]KOX13909.1 beta-mannosidase [Saccharothrix sp. NRRL B-16348]